MAFNVLCNASGQVINREDPVRVIALSRQMDFWPGRIADDNGTIIDVHGATFSITDPTAYWSPVAMIFPPGMYDEYGGLTRDVDLTSVSDAQWVTRLRLLRSIMERMPEVLPDGHTSHDAGFNPKTFMALNAPELAQIDNDVTAVLSDKAREQINMLWEALWNLADKDRLYIKLNNGEYSPVKFAIVHEAAYQGLMSAAKVSRSYDEQLISQEEFVSRCLTDIKRTATESTNADNPFDKHLRQGRLRERLSSWVSYASRLGSQLGHGLIQIAHDSLDAFLDTGDIVPLEQDMRLLAESVYVVAGMDRMCLSFMPMRYAGDDFDNESGKLFEQFVSKTRASVDRVREENRWGPYQAYQLTANSEEHALELLAELNDDWGCRANLLELSAQQDGSMIMSIESTMTEDHFSRFVDSNGNSPRPKC